MEMNEIGYQEKDGFLVLNLSGIIDAANAPDVEENLRKICEEHWPPSGSVILDFDKLEYISSAGLRMINRLNQKVKEAKIINANLEIYNILDMTGFTDIMKVEKAYRVIPVSHCEVIGQGANGKVYRIDRETVLKAFHGTESLENIERERKLARAAFAAGVPTAIPYDVVKIEGGGYGTVYELLDAVTFAKLLSSGEKTPEELAEKNVNLLKLIHSKQARSDLIPDMKHVALGWVNDIKAHVPADLFGKLQDIISNMPQDMHLVHGDCHIKNIMLQREEVLLIDMDTLSHGHPVFDLGSMYNAYLGYGALDHSVVPEFLGISYELSQSFWEKCLALYLETEEPGRLKEVENKAKIVGYTRILRRAICHRGEKKHSGPEQAMIDYCRKELTDLLRAEDTLLF